MTFPDVSIIPIRTYGLEPGKVYLLEVAATALSEHQCQQLASQLAHANLQVLLVRTATGAGLRMVPTEREGEGNERS